MRAGRSAMEAIAEIAPDLARIEEVMGAEEVADIVARLERLRRLARRQPLSGAAISNSRGNGLRAVSARSRIRPDARPRQPTKDSTSSTGLPAAISDTMAEPTTQPSATPAIASEASGVLMPKPTITGRSVAP
jgi:hypothetical protein